LRVIISGRHVSVTKAIKDYAREKAERLDRYHRGLDTVRLTLDVEHGDNTAEVVISARRSTFVVGVQGGDMYAVIDTLMEKTQKQLRRHKKKIEDRKTGKKTSKKQGRMSSERRQSL
jgi:putative sigma-54 modulation protein